MEPDMSKCCAHCAVLVPAEQAIIGPTGKPFCSQQHAELYAILTRTQKPSKTIKKQQTKR